MTLLVDVALGDLQVPSNPYDLPDKGVDVAVLPDDMVDHLRAADVFPVAPTVQGPSRPMPVVGGGRCVWAAARAGWNRPIQCVLLGSAPPGMSVVELRVASAEGPKCLVHTASFSRALSEQERADVVVRLEDLASRMAGGGIQGFSRLKHVRWARPDLLHLTAPAGAADAPTLGREFWALFSGLVADGIPLRAWDGRKVL